MGAKHSSITSAFLWKVRNENLLIYIVSFQIFRTSRSAVKGECFAPQTEEGKYELEDKIKDYSKIIKFPSNFNDIRRNQNYIMQQNTEDVFSKL